MDRSFAEQNRASTERLRKLVARLNDADMGRRVGPDWTVAVALSHLAFWDRRVQFVLDRTETQGILSAVEIDLVVNDLLLPTWELVPGREAARLAVETAEALDRRLELFPETLLEQVQAHNPRWILRALHRNQHLNEVEAALK
ncbi:MAG: maleylpyruvate isomerase N-terminal domain-containing protein [Anaerolineae bacterium]